MHLAQVNHEILYTVNPLASAISKPSKAHIARAKYLFRYLAGTTDFAITYKQEGFILT